MVPWTYFPSCQVRGIMASLRQPGAFFGRPGVGALDREAPRDIVIERLVGPKFEIARPREVAAGDAVALLTDSATRTHG